MFTLNGLVLTMIFNAAMGLIHYLMAHTVLINYMCVLGLLLCYLLFANGGGGVQYYLHLIFQPIVASPLSDTKLNHV